MFISRASCKYYSRSRDSTPESKRVSNRYGKLIVFEPTQNMAQQALEAFKGPYSDYTFIGINSNRQWVECR